MTPGQLNEVAIAAGRESIRSLAELLDHALQSNSYPDSETPSHAGLERLYAHKLITRADRHQLDMIVHLTSFGGAFGCFVSDFADGEHVDVSAAVVRTCDNIVGDDQASPVAKAIASIAIHWLTVPSLSDSDAQQSVASLMADKMDIEIERLEYVLESAILGACDAIPDCQHAINAAIAGTALRLRTYYNDEVQQCRGRMIADAVELVAEIGDGFYSSRFLSHFRIDDVRLAGRNCKSAIAQRIIAEHIASLGTDVEFWEYFRNPAHGAVEVQYVDSFLSTGKHDVAEYDFAMYTTDHLLEGIFTAVRRGLPSVATMIVDGLRAAHYPFDNYIAHSGECNRRLQLTLRQELPGVVGNSDKVVCDREGKYCCDITWEPYNVKVSRGDRPLMEIRNQEPSDEDEAIKVLDTELVGTLADRGLTVEVRGDSANGHVGFPDGEAADFAAFVETIISALSSLSPVDRP